VALIKYRPQPHRSLKTKCSLNFFSAGFQVVGCEFHAGNLAWVGSVVTATWHRDDDKNGNGKRGASGNTRTRTRGASSSARGYTRTSTSTRGASTSTSGTSTTHKGKRDDRGHRRKRKHEHEPQHGRKHRQKRKFRHQREHKFEAGVSHAICFKWNVVAAVRFTVTPVKYD